MATHSSVLAWRIPGTAEPGGLLSLGFHKVGHDWSNLAAATAWKRIVRLEWCKQGVELIERDQGGIRLCFIIILWTPFWSDGNLSKCFDCGVMGMPGVHQGLPQTTILRLEGRATMQQGGPLKSCCSPDEGQQQCEPRWQLWRPWEGVRF